MDEMAKPNECGENRHDAAVAEAESRCVETVLGESWSGHLLEGGHIGCRHGVCGFGVGQTPVGGFANCPEGIPVLSTDAPWDSEIAGIADDRFRS